MVLKGRETLDASGFVVAPGFIDLHQHGQTPADYERNAADGVTTALELEVGTADIDRWYDERRERAAIHYGVSIGHIPVRMQVMKDPGAYQRFHRHCPRHRQWHAGDSESADRVRRHSRTARPRIRLRSPVITASDSVHP